ncbi:MAG: MobC family plasmid mobilization relaxosome protein, partial [Alphaproteobacteria bacterium]|nr:MobC family plasmid mobilization relaxosome protein [Alphaproteobacteria bacterium]
GGEHEALRAIMRELNRIGANINQIALAANGGALYGAAVDADLSDIREVKAVVEKTLAELRRVFDDNAAYWEGR